MKFVVLPEAEEIHVRFKGLSKKAEFIKAYDYEQLDKAVEKGDIILYGGGEDISPFLYGETPVFTHAPPTPSQRDMFELAAFRLGQERGAKNFGICRGSQFLAAMSGFPLYQHVTDHTTSHEIHTSDGDHYLANSTHHQMWDLTKFKPGEDGKILAWAVHTARKYYDRTKKQLVKNFPEGKLLEPEVAYFSKTRSLAIQGHPEYENAPEAYIVYCKHVFNKYLKAA